MSAEDPFGLRISTRIAEDPRTPHIALGGLAGLFVIVLIAHIA